MSKFRLTQEAADKLEEIWLYSADRWGPEQADSYLSKLESGFQRIADGLASAYSCQKFNPHLPEEIHYYLVERHFVIFQDASDGVVDIITVVHAVSNEQLSEFLSRLS